MSSDQLNENYFENIDTNEKAYWLGFFYADGYVAKDRNLIKLNLSKKDEEIIDNFIKCLNINPSKKRYITRYLKTTNKYYECIDLGINNKKLKSDLNKHGCSPLKTFRLTLPILNSNELYDAFLCGFYDGDGFQKGNYICCGCLKFLNEIKQKYNISFEPKLKINPYGQCYVMCIGWELRNKILNSYPNSLKRKRIFSNGPSSFEIGNNHNTLTDDDYTQKYDYIDLNEFETLIKIKGLEFISKHYKIDVKAIRRLCKINNIYLPTKEERHNQQMRYEVSKEELENLIKEKSFVQIGKMFNVSDNAIRKRCKKLGIEIPKREPGYWAKQYALDNSKP